MQASIIVVLGVLVLILGVLLFTGGAALSPLPNSDKLIAAGLCVAGIGVAMLVFCPA